MSIQLALLSGSAPLPIEGLTYVPDFISPAEEKALIEQIENGIWSHEFARRRQHFGMVYAGSNNASAIPLWVEAIGQKILQHSLFSRMPMQALVNEYLPGQGISAHKDYAPFDEVASLSLASGCIMEFARADTDRRELWLEPRSLIILKGEARHEWTHAIRSRLNDTVNGQKAPRKRRLSLTLRTVNGKSASS